MKALTLTTTLLAALSLTAFAGSYTVKSGDTLHSISRKHKVSVAKIMSLNGISDPTKLRIGQSLRVSSASASKKSSTKNSSRSSKSSSPKTSSYKVAKGDTFYSIARRHRISVTKLQALNPKVRSHMISPGQSLKVTGTASSTAAKKASKKPTVVVNVKKKKVEQEQSPQKTTIALKASDPIAPKTETITLVEEPESIPISTPPAPPVLEKVTFDEPKEMTKASSSVSSVILTDQTTFDAFASKHGTDTAQLNALNGWNLPKATVLARGSEIYVPQ